MKQSLQSIAMKTTNSKQKVFGAATDIFYVPIVINESKITKRDDRRKITYRIVGSLSKHSQVDTKRASLHTKHDTPKHRINTSGNTIELVGVDVGLDQVLLDERVRQVSSWSFSHLLTLNFSHHSGKGYRISYSIESAKHCVQFLLEEIRRESKRLHKQNLEFPSKKELQKYQDILGVIEFGPELMGIHFHLLLNCHPDLTEDWIAEKWNLAIRDEKAIDDTNRELKKELRKVDASATSVKKLLARIKKLQGEKGSVRLFPIGVPIPPTSVRVEKMKERDKAVTYVVSRIMQYEMIPTMTWDDAYGDITMNEYDIKLVIESIEGHKKNQRYSGRKSNLPRFRKQS